jgi:hypothetical protein
MKTMFLAAAAVLGIGMGSAYADGGQGTIPNTFFTELPGVVAQAPGQTARGAVGANSQVAHTQAYVTNPSTGTWLFPPNQNQGANS